MNAPCDDEWRGMGRGGELFPFLRYTS
jgi:hypothetical protein